MKKNVLMYLVLILSVTISGGCHYLVPNPIKRETSLVKTDVTVCLMEINNIEKDEAKSEVERLKAANEKAKRTLRRLKPHLENLDNYTHGRPATR